MSEPTPRCADSSPPPEPSPDAAFRATQPATQVPAFDTSGEPIQHRGPAVPSPTTTPVGTFLSVDLCPRHGFAMLAMATLDDSGFGGGTRLLGPKSCCADRREVARWRVSADDLARIAEAVAPSAPLDDGGARRYDVEAQERVVSALWNFARALGHTERDCDTTQLIHDGVRPALAEILDAFGHGIVSIE